MATMAAIKRNFIIIVDKNFGTAETGKLQPEVLFMWAVLKS